MFFRPMRRTEPYSVRGCIQEKLGASVLCFFLSYVVPIVFLNQVYLSVNGATFQRGYLRCIGLLRKNEPWDLGGCFSSRKKRRKVALSKGIDTPLSFIPNISKGKNSIGKQTSKIPVIFELSLNCWSVPWTSRKANHDSRPHTLRGAHWGIPQRCFLLRAHSVYTAKKHRNRKIHRKRESE
jgi:hypothetical protein